MNTRLSQCLFILLFSTTISNMTFAEQPAFSSRPDSPNVLYLDFDGEDETENHDWIPVVALPSGLGDGQIRESWALAAEAFTTFDVNVTTDRALYDATPVTTRQKCIVTRTSASSVTSNGNADGVAMRNTFGFDIPCWSFDPLDYGVVIHELGHTLGLSHDGTSSNREEEYHRGENGWVPIMGRQDNNKELIQWSKGEYEWANNPSDDIQNIGERLGFIPDDVGDSITDASPVTFMGSSTTGYTVEVEGIISTESDTDFYRVDVPAGSHQLNIDIKPFYISNLRGTLPIKITLHDVLGQIIAEDSADPRRATYQEAGHQSTLSLDSLNADTYYISIEGLEVPVAGDTKYGSIGTYLISIDLDALNIEENLGEFSGNFASPSEIMLTEGENNVRGQITGGDSDYITFKVPSGYQIGSITVDENSVSPNFLSLAHRFGSAFGQSGLSGGIDGVVQINKNLGENYNEFRNVGAGEHTFLITSSGASSASEDYSLIFNIIPAILTSYDESNDGDLSALVEPSTNLGTLDKVATIRGTIGRNGNADISGTFGGGDSDSFTVTVPQGYALDFASVDTDEFIIVASNAGLDLPNYVNESYKELYASGQSGLDYSDYEAGVYTFNIVTVYGGSHSASGSYEITFNLLPLADGWANQDIGDVSTAGSLTVNPSGEITLTASGADIYGTKDEFQFAYLPLNGDGEITAQVINLTNTNQWAKAGVMIRETLDADSVNAMTLVSASKGISSQSRDTRGARTFFSKTEPSATAPYWVRLNRAGDVFTSSLSSNGINWTVFKTWTVSMAEEVYIGLASTSHADGVVTTAVFDNVSIIGTEESDVGVTIDATQYSSESAPTNESVIRNMETKIGYIAVNSWVSYDSFNFGYSGVSSIDVLASSRINGGTIELRLGSPTGESVGSVKVERTGSWGKFETFSGSFSAPVTGTHDLYLVFLGQSGYLFDIKSFQINQ